MRRVDTSFAPFGQHQTQKRKGFSREAHPGSDGLHEFPKIGPNRQNRMALSEGLEFDLGCGLRPICKPVSRQKGRLNVERQRLVADHPKRDREIHPCCISVVHFGIDFGTKPDGFDSPKGWACARGFGFVERNILQLQLGLQGRGPLKLSFL